MQRRVTSLSLSLSFRFRVFPTTEQETSTEPTTEQELIPQYHLDLEGMDNILKGLIEELSQDDDLRALMNGPFEFEDDQHLW